MAGRPHPDRNKEDKYNEVQKYKNAKPTMTSKYLQGIAK